MSLVRNYHNTKFKIHSTYSTTKRIPKIVLMVSLHSNSFMYLQFSLEDNFTAVGHNVLPLPARNTLLQLGQLSQGLLSRLATRTISDRQGSQSPIEDTITLMKFQPVEDLALFSDRFSREEVRHEDAGGTGAGELPLERGEHSRHLLQAVLVFLEGGQLGQQLCLKKNMK